MMAGTLMHLDRLSPAEQLQEFYEKLIEPTLIDPCFVTHVPSVIIPLARENREDPFFADVYELAINGQEISPGYTELNDPDVQAEQFAHQVARLRRAPAVAERDDLPPRPQGLDQSARHPFGRPAQSFGAPRDHLPVGLEVFRYEVGFHLYPMFPL